MIVINKNSSTEKSMIILIKPSNHRKFIKQNRQMAGSSMQKIQPNLDTLPSATESQPKNIRSIGPAALLFVMTTGALLKADTAIEFTTRMVS